MAGEAVVLGELGPRLLRVAGPRLQVLHRHAHADQLAGHPQAGGEVGLGAVDGRAPVMRHPIHLGRHVEEQRGVAGADQVVVDFVVRAALVTAGADVGPHHRVAQVPHAVGGLLLTIQRLPEGQVVDRLPFTGGPVAHLAADPLGGVKLRPLQRRRDAHRVALQAEFLALGVNAVCGSQAAQVGEHQARALAAQDERSVGVRVVARPFGDGALETRSPPRPAHRAAGRGRRRRRRSRRPRRRIALPADRSGSPRRRRWQRAPRRRTGQGPRRPGP